MTIDFPCLRKGRSHWVPNNGPDHDDDMRMVLESLQKFLVDQDGGGDSSSSSSVAGTSYSSASSSSSASSAISIPLMDLPRSSGLAKDGEDNNR